MKENFKRILDSVHGYIEIPKIYCDKIVDTIYFQRLRRIEQTSGRSLFPCARHDRFIHSLGVFHIGSKIVESIKEKYQNPFKSKENDEKVFDSYVVACLLHDVGHTPFSHTFEGYYKIGNDLKKILCEEVNDETFNQDWQNCFKKCAPHEIISAYLALRIFGKVIKEISKADLCLIARMIVGCKYKDIDNFSFENAFIDLIHGDIIDADGLDYVCRDAWASGYYTSKIDVDRLIDSIKIEKNNQGNYEVCYTAKALNEIEAVLNVKSFQQSNVITHHTVVYEQELLKEAMKSAALYHLDGKESSEDEDERDKALAGLCNIKSYFEPYELKFSKVKILYPMDDDFVSLMKYIPDDKYVCQWIGREYKLKPLWKSKADFFSMFPILIGKKYKDECWLFSPHSKTFISENFDIPTTDIWVKSASPKDKRNLASKVNLYVGGSMLPYSNLFYKDKNSFEPHLNPFYYIYVPKEADAGSIVKALKEELEKFIFSIDAD